MKYGETFNPSLKQKGFFPDCLEPVYNSALSFWEEAGDSSDKQQFLK